MRQRQRSNQLNLDKPPSGIFYAKENAMSQNKESYAEDAGYYEALRIKRQAEHEAMIKAEAQEYGVSVEEYERGHSAEVDKFLENRND